MRSHFLLVEAERYRSLAMRTVDRDAAGRWLNVVSEYEALATKFDTFDNGTSTAEIVDGK